MSKQLNPILIAVRIILYSALLFCCMHLAQFINNQSAALGFFSLGSVTMELLNNLQAPRCLVSYLVCVVTIILSGLATLLFVV